MLFKILTSKHLNKRFERVVLTKCCLFTIFTQTRQYTLSTAQNFAYLWSSISLGTTVIPRDNYYAKFWGVNKVDYGLCEKGEFAFFELRVRLGRCWAQLHYGNVLVTLPLLWLAFARLHRNLGKKFGSQNSPIMQFDITLTQSNAHFKTANKATQCDFWGCVVWKIQIQGSIWRVIWEIICLG